MSDTSDKQETQSYHTDVSECNHVKKEGDNSKNELTTSATPTTCYEVQVFK